MYEFQSAMAEGKARAQRERNRGNSSAVRIMSTAEHFAGMSEEEWESMEHHAEPDDYEAIDDWQFHNESGGDDVDAPSPPKRETEESKPRSPVAPREPRPNKSQSMTSKQYLAALKKLGLAAYSTAPAALGISLRTSAGYASGGRQIPATVAKLIRALVKLGTADV